MYHCQRSSQGQNLFANGLNLHIRHWPGHDKNLPIVVLLHGWMDSSAGFQFLVDQIDPAWSIYAPDWRGMGLSDHQAYGYYDRTIMLADLVAIIDHISPQKPVFLLGHSLGGMIGAHYVALFPERVAAFVMAEAFGMIENSFSEHMPRLRRLLLHMDHPKPMRIIKDYAEGATRLQQRHPCLNHDMALFLSHAMLKAHKNGDFIWRADSRHNLPQPLPYLEARDYDYWRKIQAPLLWLQGDFVAHNDYLALIRASLEARYAALGQPERIIFANTGHMLHWEQPKSMAVACMNFWQNCKDHT